MLDRTVYQITEEGRLELVVQRDAALAVVFGSAVGGARPVEVVGGAGPVGAAR
jgi:hypothetical protein